MDFKRFLSVFLSILLLLCAVSLSSCKNDNGEETTTGYEYTPSGFEDENSTAKAENNELQEKISVDNSWQKNFSVSYEYYNPEQNISTMKINEKKSESAFTVEYVDTKSILYYKANGKDTDYYVIIDNEEEQVHSVLKDKSFSSLSSMFMKLTALSPELPSQSNVLYMYDEEVGGRLCHKYIQRAYQGGNLTQSVYVWVDAEFGFAAKCEAYDSNNKLTVMWKVTAFETGKLSDEDVFLDISQYSFKENAG